jgi:hypothetical protein
MILTEEVAKTKRCCGPEGCGGETTDNLYIEVSGHRSRLCIGSACMAWCFATVVTKGEIPSSQTKPDWTVTEDRSRGYCGYAWR